MTTRRTFVRTAAGTAPCALGTPRFASAALSPEELEGVAGAGSPKQVAQDEAYWEVIQRACTQDSSFINLESGFFSPAADPVVEVQVQNLRRIKQIPSFYMRRLIAEEREDLKTVFGARASRLTSSRACHSWPFLSKREWEWRPALA